MSDTNAAVNTNNESEDLKIFTIRCVPPDVHKMWKTISFLESKTMEQFAVEAIREKISKYSTNKPEVKTEVKTEIKTDDNKKD